MANDTFFAATLICTLVGMGTEYDLELHPHAPRQLLPQMYNTF